MTNPQQPDTNPEETLKRIQTLLEDWQASTRLAAIKELSSKKYSSPAILRTLEKLALRDHSKPVRNAARQALGSPTHRYIQSRTTKLNRRERQTLLGEIQAWEEQELLQREQAEILCARYDFDLRPTTPPPASEPAAAPLAASSPTATPAPPSQRPTLIQTLLSEASIKIALYLGAFFVIAAAAILAAVVESARLPILLAATALFGGAALAIRRRLPQPGFALFIVFSFLLPTDANVLADTLNLTARANALYWFAAMGSMALIWGFGTWFCRSRLFSLAAFVALAISFGRLAEALNSEAEIYLLFFSLVTLAGLGGAYLLKRWQQGPLWGSQTFSLPLLLLVQIVQVALSLLALVAVFNRMDDPPAAWSLLTALYWLIAAGFYILSDLAFPFFLFPWLAATILYPFPLTLLQGLSIESPQNAAITWGWGLMLALVSEGLRLFGAGATRRHALPLLLVSLPVILTAAGLGFSNEVPYGFACLLAGGLLYALLQIFKPRVYVWSAALLLVLGAYFSFYLLPFIENIDVFVGYQFLIASLFYLLPDLALKPDLSAAAGWRWPLRAIGGFLAFCNLASILPVAFGQPGSAAISYGAHALFFVFYALRLDKAWLAYIATASASLGIIFALQHLDADAWLPALTGLAALYCSIGWILHKQRIFAWSAMMRVSGLTLGGLVSLIALVTLKETGGWYILITGALFTIEMFLRRNGWLEAGPQTFFPAALALLLYDYNVKETAWYLLGIGLLWLTLDLGLGRAFPGKRPLRWPVRGLAALLVFTNMLYLIAQGTDDPHVALACFATYTLYFLGLAALHREPRLGYGLTLFSMLTTIYSLQILDDNRWLLPVAALAALYYGAGFYLRKRGAGNLGGGDWPFVLWISGIGIGLVASFFAPFHADFYRNGLVIAIPPTLTATLIMVEAFDRRNVWLGFPANALYLLGYFLILIELRVDEPQFYSIAVAALGLLMHYLLTRAGSKTGAFVTGMISQLALLSVTYIQFLSNGRLVFFAILFFQALAVLAYGLVIRSRSLVIAPIIFSVLAVISVMYGLMQGIWAVLLIGCTGMLLLMLGILAVILRERIKQFTERFNDWGA